MSTTEPQSLPPNVSLSEILPVLVDLFRAFDLTWAQTGTLMARTTKSLLTSEQTLKVPGALLRYTTQGSGPLLLLIPGAYGTGTIFQPLAVGLSKHFTVATYARRGFDDSVFTSEQDFTHRLSTDAADAAALLAHLSPGKKGHVFGNSSGAVVALELLRLFPDAVDKVLLHEPPKMLADTVHGETWTAFFESCYKMYLSHGIAPAVTRFAQPLGQGLEVRLVQIALRIKAKEANTRYWFERELNVYPASKFTETEALQRKRGDVEILLGEETAELYAAGKDAPLAGPAYAIGRVLGKEVVIVPAGHIGFAPRPRAFAESMLKLLGV